MQQVSDWRADLAQRAGLVDDAGQLAMRQRYVDGGSLRIRVIH